MRLLPYSKRLIERRKAGERPWLTVVMMGDSSSRLLGRMATFSGDKELARIWLPDDFRIAEADLVWAIGLDVLVFWVDWTERVTEIQWALWRARVATLWTRHCKTEREPHTGQWHDNWSKFTASIVMTYTSVIRGTQFFSGTHHQVPLDAGFRSVVERRRELALICADEPLFQDPLFSGERLKLLAA